MTPKRWRAGPGPWEVVDKTETETILRQDACSPCFVVPRYVTTIDPNEEFPVVGPFGMHPIVRCDETCETYLQELLGLMATRRLEGHGEEQDFLDGLEMVTRLARMAWRAEHEGADDHTIVYPMDLRKELDPTQPVTVQIRVPTPERSPDEASE